MNRPYSKKKRYITLWLFLVTFTSLYAQPFPPPSYLQQLFLGFPILGFVDNSEYFNKIEIGRTLIGYQLNPYLYFYPLEGLQVDLGIFMQYDLGSSNFLSKIKPTFSLGYKKNNFYFLFGNYNWQDDHRFINPLYNRSHKLLEETPQGLAFKYETDIVFANIWIDWKRALNKSKNKPEYFVVGSSLYYHFISNHKITMSIPIQVLLYHLGGQGITTKCYSLVYGTIGIQKSLMLGLSWLQKIMGEGYYILSNYTKEIGRPFKKGFGCYTSLTLATSWFSLIGSYWWGNGFSSENIGTPIYQSIRLSDGKVKHHEKIRSLLFLQINYPFSLAKKIKCQLYIEPYYDFRNKLLEHAAGFTITYRPCFQLTNKKLVDQNKTVSKRR